MAIISRIGRRSVKVRALIWIIYATLMLGALTMIYPFALMIAGSTKSNVDMPAARVIPPFLRSDEALYRKHMEGFFNESLDAFRIAYHSDAAAFGKVAMPPSPNMALADAWRAFIEQADLPPYSYAMAYIRAPRSRGVFPHVLRDLRGQLQVKYGDDIDRANREMKTTFADWTTFYVLPKDYLPRRNTVSGEPLQVALWAFQEGRPVEERYYFSVEGFYKMLFLKTQYSRRIENYNREHGTTYASWADVHLDRRYPEGLGRTDKERADWEEFVRTLVNLFWVRADARAAPAYRAFLKAKYRTLDGLNRNYGIRYASLDDVALPGEPPPGGLPLSDWDLFLQGWKDPDTGDVHKLPIRMARIHSVDFLFRDHLRERYGTIEKANGALGTTYGTWMDALPPQQDLHLAAFLGQRGFLRREFCKRNFLAVLDYMVLHGRAILNTTIYCALAIVAALIVNPLAAYALSRYRPPSTYKVLLFLMLTMAFPPMVTQIPAFLMLREFGMLNTFWALILPGLANGYWIFLLKGFFDSLPQELYECAALDGAGEIRIFWQITMALSRPVLAVIGLQAFTFAYSNFMMALLICQDQKMWTLMPWLYQLQMRSGQGVVFASLLVAAVPTFVVFAFCQNVIMRGIVVPVEK